MVFIFEVGYHFLRIIDRFFEAFYFFPFLSIFSSINVFGSNGADEFKLVDVYIFYNLET